MMVNKPFIGFAALAVFALAAAYIFLFNSERLPGLTRDPAVLGQLGDYVGGLLNPVLSFISVLLLIRSLTLQNSANSVLVSQVSDAKRAEKLRSFESRLFHMIEAQRLSFESLSYKRGPLRSTYYASDAVAAVEDRVHQLREEGASDSHISSVLESIDSRDQMYGAVRKFSIMVRMIEECLSDAEGFDQQDRVRHVICVINFADFALVRLVILMLQFSDSFPCQYLRNSGDFKKAADSLDLPIDCY